MSGIAGLDLATSYRAPSTAPLCGTQYYDQDDEYFEEEISLNGEEMAYYGISRLSTIAEESLSDLHASIRSHGSFPSPNSHNFDRSNEFPKSTPSKNKDTHSLNSSSMLAKQQEQQRQQEQRQQEQEQEQQVGNNANTRGEPTTAIVFLEVGDESKMVLSSPQQKDRKLSLENFLDFTRQEEKKKKSNHISLYSTMTEEEVLVPEDDDEFTFVTYSSNGGGFSIASEGTGAFSEQSISGKEVLGDEASQDPQGKVAKQDKGFDVAETKLDQQPSENCWKEQTATDPRGDLTKNKNNPRFVSARRKLSYEMSRKRLKKSFERGRQPLPAKENTKILDPLRRKMNFDLSRIKFNENFKKKVRPSYRKYLKENFDPTQEQSKSERVERFGGLQRKKSYVLSQKMFEDNVQKAQLVRMLVNKSEDLSSLTPEQERQHTLAATYDRSRRRIRYDVSRCQLQSQLKARVEGSLS